MDYYLYDLYHEYDPAFDCMFKVIVLISFDGKDKCVDKEVLIDDDRDLFYPNPYTDYDSTFDCLMYTEVLHDECGFATDETETYLACSKFENENFVDAFISAYNPFE